MIFSMIMTAFTLLIHIPILIPILMMTFLILKKML